MVRKGPASTTSASTAATAPTSTQAIPLPSGMGSSMDGFGISSSGVIGKAENGVKKKAFSCTYPGCTKSFQRKEHLNRHSLNHYPTKTYSCEKCGKEFYRRDLYNRHLERHAKGMWFRRSGNLTKQAEAKRQQDQIDQQNKIPDPIDHQLIPQGPPPLGQHMDRGGVPPPPLQHTHSHLGHLPPLNSTSPIPPPLPSSIPQSQHLPSVKLPNMANDMSIYSSPAPMNMFHPPLPTNVVQPQQMQQMIPQQSIPQQSMHQQMQYQQPIGYPTPHQVYQSAPVVPPQVHQQQHQYLPYTQQQQQPPPPPQPQQQQQPPPHLQQHQHQQQQPAVTTTSKDVYGIGSYHQEDDLHWLFEGSLETMEGQLATIRDQPHPAMASMVTTPRRLEDLTPPPEVLDEEQIWLTVRQKLNKTLFNIEDGQPSDSPLEACTLANTFSIDLLDTWLNDPDRLKEFFHVYFEAYHDHFPVVHKVSFLKRPDKIPPLLMIAIVTLGTAFSSKEDFNVSVKLHERLRWLIFSHNELVNPPLWIFQSLVLLQAFEKMLSIPAHHALAACFHGAMVNLLRRSQPRFTEEDQDPQGPLQARWLKWIEQESFRRTYYLAFIMDSQHAAIFGHRAAMSANEILFELPCLEQRWDAEDAETWQSLSSETTPAFLSGLKSLLMLKPMSATTSHYALLILLHGLYSVAIHMQMQKGQTLGMANRMDSECKHCGSKNIQQREYPFEHWKMILGQAINTWSYCLYSSQKSITIEVSMALHQLAYVTLHLSPPSILDVLVVCNYPLLIDRQISKADYYKADRAIKLWARSNEATMCVKHALLLVQETLFARTSNYYMSGETEHYCAKVDKIALRPWSLFICTLVIWSFHSSLNLPDLPAPVTDNVNVWAHSEQYLSTRIQALSSLNTDAALHMFTRMELSDPSGLTCLVTAVQSTLPGCRWSMLDQAYDCLGDLIKPLAN